MREITDHKLNGLNEALRLLAVDEPGYGGANHAYLVTLEVPHECDRHWRIDFQNGPIQEAGLNGLSNEVLLAVLVDRLHGFQCGSYPTPENKAALFHLNEALHCLKQRTLDRVARGVEGTHKL